jgi:hypothetical protein
MAAAAPVDIAVNPNDETQWYILWSNGRIDAVNAPPIEDQTTWYDRFEPPGVAIHIENWTTGAGWVLDYRGGFNPLNGATHASVGLGDNPTAMSGVPVSASPRARLYVDWSWDPAGTGQGYVLDRYGKITPFGGATAPPRAGNRWSTPQAIRLEMQWTPSKKAITVDGYGRLFTDFAATVGASSFPRPKFGAIRDFKVTNWTDGSGYLLDLYGRLHRFGTATAVSGFPVNTGGDMARVLAVLSPTDPAEFLEVWANGQRYQFISSTPPTVVAGGETDVSPAATTTDTTRPDLRWDYSDPQGDSQAAYQVLVFTQAFVTGHSMTNPLAWVDDALVFKEGIDPTVRGVDMPVDLANGTYRMYVRAQDTAGQWSAWANLGWTQNVTTPSTPTGLTATVNASTYSVGLSVTTDTTGDLAKFVYSDDGGMTWADVRGASGLPQGTTVTATDYDVPLNVARTYAAILYSEDPRVASARSTTQTVTLVAVAYVLTAVDDTTLGGELRVQEPVEWTRTISGGVFLGLDAEYPTIVKSTNPPRGRRSTVHVFTDDADARATVEALVLSGSTLVYRDPFGAVRYCEIVGENPEVLMPGAAERPLHDTDLPLVEVAPPSES